MKTLTDSELNLALCEWMGWTAKEDEDGFWRAVDPIHGTRPKKWVSERNVLMVGFPNFLSDDSPRRLLNEVEARLTEIQKLEYLRHLTQLENYGRLAHARQRTIAILMTVKPEMFK